MGSDNVCLSTITLDVFTTRFSGNRLAIVHVPKDLKDVLSQTQTNDRGDVDGLDR
jgi:hypothetical protein